MNEEIVERPSDPKFSIQRYINKNLDNKYNTKIN